MLYTGDTMTNFFSWFRKIILTILLSFLFSGSSLATENGAIQVNIKGINVDLGGSLIIALFHTEGSWPKHDSALARKVAPVSEDSIQIKFDQITLHNTYAVQVLHDENQNDKLDFRWFPYPRPEEGTGVSNNNRRMGPPSFEKALFSAENPETNIEINLKY